LPDQEKFWSCLFKLSRILHSHFLDIESRAIFFICSRLFLILPIEAVGRSHGSSVALGSWDLGAPRMQAPKFHPSTSAHVEATAAQYQDT
jgi:hypothetical protein